MTAETSQTLGRGLRVLEVLVRHSQRADDHRARRRGRCEPHGGVPPRRDLEVHGLARRDAAGLVHVGLGVLALARGLQPVLRELAAPVLRSLAEDLGMTAHLTVADGGEALAIAVVEPTWTDFHVGYRVGARHPLGLGAAGRAILLGRHAAGDGASDSGYVETAGELQAGARGVAAPVLGLDGLEASVGIVTLGDLDVAMVGPLVVNAATRVASRLS